MLAEKIVSETASLLQWELADGAATGRADVCRIRIADMPTRLGK